MSIPKVGKRSIFDKELPGEIAQATGALGLGILTVSKAFVDYGKDQTSGWLVWIQVFVSAILLWSAVHKIFKAFRKDKRDDLAKDPGELEGCLHVFFVLLSRRLSIKDHDGTLRITLYTVDAERGSEDGALQQVTQYVGGDGGPKGRNHLMRCGIIGRVARTGEAYACKRKGTTLDEFRKELMAEWGYTAEETLQISQDREAWMAAPILGKSHKAVVGVLYLDTNRRDLFDDDTVKKLVVFASIGIASYAKVKYA